MTISGIGVDIVDIRRITRSVSRFGSRLEKRILAGSELERIETTMPLQARAAYLARQFAAKEAVSKALGTGMRQGISFSQIQVLRRTSGAPYVVLTGAAEARARQSGIESVHISLSDERNYAMAYAVAEGAEGEEGARENGSG